VNDGTQAVLVFSGCFGWWPTTAGTWSACGLSSWLRAGGPRSCCCRRGQ